MSGLVVFRGEILNAELTGEIPVLKNFLSVLHSITNEVLSFYPVENVQFGHMSKKTEIEKKQSLFKKPEITL